MDFTPDIVIVAIGENLAPLGTERSKNEFAVAFARLLAQFKSNGNPAIVVRSSFIADPTFGVMRHVADTAALFTWSRRGSAMTPTTTRTQSRTTPTITLSTAIPATRAWLLLPSRSIAASSPTHSPSPKRTTVAFPLAGAACRLSVGGGGMPSAAHLHDRAKPGKSGARYRFRSICTKRVTRRQITMSEALRRVRSMERQPSASISQVTFAEKDFGCDRQSAAWRGHLLSAGLIALVALLAYGPLLRPGYIPYSKNSDLIGEHLSRKWAAYRSLHAGQGLPFWKADQFSGGSALIHPSAMYACPLHFLFNLIDPAAAAGPTFWLQFLVMGLGMYLWGCSLGLGLYGRLLMAVAGMLNFKLILMAYAGWLVAIPALVMWPILMAALVIVSARPASYRRRR